jgi:hypothetical protein
MIVHGDSKIGKTWLGDTAPAPRLCLDAEGGVDWTESRKIEWDPITQKPPVNDGTWDTCIVRVRNYQTVDLARQWIASGQHPFRSVILDSISEVQQRCIDAMVGVDPMKTQDWGELLRKMSSLVREFRDYTLHPTNPLTAVILVAMSRLNANGKYIPYVQGQLATTLPYYFDVIGYLFLQDLEDGSKIRRLLVSPHPLYEAGERLGGRLGVVVDNPNISTMLDMVYGPEQSANGN